MMAEQAQHGSEHAENPKEQAPEGQGGQAGEAARRTPPAPTFANFVQSLAGQCLIAMGHAKNPLTGKAQPDLEQAKYTIDLLGMVEEKTKGNLEENEAKLLSGVLCDLRMRYVEACRRHA